MVIASKPVLTNTYIPKKTKNKNKTKKEVQMVGTRSDDVFDDLKFKQFASDTDSYFQQTPVINFDIIDHECSGVPLQNSEQHYKTIQKKRL